MSSVALRNTIVAYCSKTGFSWTESKGTPSWLSSTGFLLKDTMALLVTL